MMTWLEISGRRWRPLLLMVLAGFLVQEAGGLRLRWVDDETWYLLPAKALVDEGRLRIPVFDTAERHLWAMPPLLTVLEALSWRLRELTVLQARLLPLAFGTGVVLLTFVLGARLFGAGVGLLAAVFCATDNMVFLAARTVRPEILVAFFALLTLALVDAGLATSRTSLLAGAGLAAGAGMLSHPNGAAALLLAVILMVARHRFNARALAMLLVFSAVALVPWIAFLVREDGQAGFASFRALLRLQTAGAEEPLSWLVRSATREVTQRYAAFLAFPYRLHVALAVVIAVAVSLWRGSRESRALGLSVLLYLSFFLFVTRANKTPRYLALVMPFVAILWGRGVTWLLESASTIGASSGTRLRRALAVGVVVALAGSQLAGNILYVWRHRQADVESVTREIDRLIPGSSSIYGGMALWIGLRHHRYIPYMRMTWDRAQSEYRPGVVLLDDWVMVKGSYPGEWDRLRAELRDHVRGHGRLLGIVSNPFYGDIKVYATRETSPGEPYRAPPAVGGDPER